MVKALIRGSKTLAAVSATLVIPAALVACGEQTPTQEGRWRLYRGPMEAATSALASGPTETPRAVPTATQRPGAATTPLPANTQAPEAQTAPTPKQVTPGKSGTTPTHIQANRGPRPASSTLQPGPAPAETPVLVEYHGNGKDTSTETDRRTQSKIRANPQGVRRRHECQSARTRERARKRRAER